MSQSVHADMVVCDVDAHGLLTHSRLVCVTRGLAKNKDIQIFIQEQNEQIYSDILKCV